MQNEKGARTESLPLFLLNQSPTGRGSFRKRPCYLLLDQMHTSNPRKFPIALWKSGQTGSIEFQSCRHRNGIERVDSLEPLSTQSNHLPDGELI